MRGVRYRAAKLLELPQDVFFLDEISNLQESQTQRNGMSDIEKLASSGSRGSDTSREAGQKFMAG